MSDTWTARGEAGPPTTSTDASAASWKEEWKGSKGAGEKYFQWAWSSRMAMSKEEDVVNLWTLSLIKYPWNDAWRLQKATNWQLKLAAAGQNQAFFLFVWFLSFCWSSKPWNRRSLVEKETSQFTDYFLQFQWRSNLLKARALIYFAPDVCVSVCVLFLCVHFGTRACKTEFMNDSVMISLQTWLWRYSNMHK